VNMTEIIKSVEKGLLRTGLPEIKVGDTIKMKLKVIEADKARLHPFEGTIIRKSGEGISAMFTVRKTSFGEGVERTFPLNSPVIESIEVVSHGKTKRARLYYLRSKLGRKSKLRTVAETS
jgi:large subunit ribosomal protein L19